MVPLLKHHLILLLQKKPVSHLLLFGARLLRNEGM